MVKWYLFTKFILELGIRFLKKLNVMSLLGFGNLQTIKYIPWNLSNLGLVKNFISSEKVACFAVIINICNQNILICLCTIKQDKNWTLESKLNFRAKFLVSCSNIIVLETFLLSLAPIVLGLTKQFSDVRRTKLSRNPLTYIFSWSLFSMIIVILISDGEAAYQRFEIPLSYDIVMALIWRFLTIKWFGRVRWTPLESLSCC